MCVSWVKYRLPNFPSQVRAHQAFEDDMEPGTASVNFLTAETHLDDKIVLVLVISLIHDHLSEKHMLSFYP